MKIYPYVHNWTLIFGLSRPISLTHYPEFIRHRIQCSKSPIKATGGYVEHHHFMRLSWVSMLSWLPISMLFFPHAAQIFHWLLHICTAWKNTQVSDDFDAKFLQETYAQTIQTYGYRVQIQHIISILAQGVAEETSLPGFYSSYRLDHVPAW